METNESPLVLEFPLRGEWLAPTTPAKKIPSHGTNQFGLRYAYDFLQVDWQTKKLPFHSLSQWHYFFLGVPLRTCYCWGADIYAPFDGEVVAINCSYKERSRVFWLTDCLIALRHAYFFKARDGFEKIAGNYLVMKHREGVFAAFAHLQTDSIKVQLHQKIKRGDFLGKVGHSGNSTSPHLHFQLMDSDDFTQAKGIPCHFANYDRYEHHKWQPVTNGIPNERDRIRFLG
ncbi:M23 family metallopeptidase [uncultured Vagococcus sp.]|uniref:M23 family metallopeptidase n=1 Tax=uncultured Vagococcus sp. TaxID=189676 RepID=UPI0028D724FB|nr:M23 family metallopeptidase [uncultured Vagococcus sp.]